MIIVITYRETDEYGNEVEVISHGIDTETLRTLHYHKMMLDM